MFEQTFALSDIPKVFFLTFLEIILSADNAIVLGVLASRLPQKLQAKALYIGSISAFVLRFIAILLIAFLIQYRFIQILGGAYLLYLSLRFLLDKRKNSSFAVGKSSFWSVVILIELFDLVFAVDSIFAGVGFISSQNIGQVSSKLWIVYVGGMIGLLSVRYAAHLFTSILKKFPKMELSAHLMIGWIGIRLILELAPHFSLFEPIFWIVLILLFIFGFTSRQKKYG
jgi:YkoY family integral membrane protein